MNPSGGPNTRTISAGLRRRFPESSSTVLHPSILAPSLLAGDHAHLAVSVRTAEAARVPWLHLDIMDGHFVPNLSFGPQVLAALRPLSRMYFDTHLMLSEPHRYIEAFAKAGSNSISIHIEPDYDHAGTLRHIRELGCKCGMVLNPDTPATAIEPFLHSVDLILVMTVQPGFGGQSFRPEMLEKLRTFSQWRNERSLNFRLEVDGGIDLETGLQCRQAGADTFVAGTSFFGASNKGEFARIVASW